jgi:menaquinone-9 beta-reductase
MKKLQAKVAIVGAGPAGSSSANALVLNGAEGVALIDKARFPRDKACGDGIGPGAVLMMKQFGLSDRLSAHSPIKYLAVSGPSGISAKGPLPVVRGSPPIGYTIPRFIFDNYLTAAALERGVLDYTGHELEEASFADGAWNLRLKTDSGEKILLVANVLIGADGARSKVRRTLGVPLNSDRHTGTAVRIYAKTSHRQFDALQIDFVRKLLPGYGWLFPIDKTRANVGIGIDLDNYKKQTRHLEDLLEIYKQALDPSIEYDDKSYLAYILPYGSELPRVAHPLLRAALVGDAGSMINPLTGEGIFYGMCAGGILGELLAPALKADSLVKIDSALIEYQSQFSKRFKPHFQLNWLMKERVEIPDWCDMVINACARDKVVLGDLIGLMMGEASDPKISTLLRIAAQNLPSLARKFFPLSWYPQAS